MRNKIIREGGDRGLFCRLHMQFQFKILFPFPLAAKLIGGAQIYWRIVSLKVLFIVYSLLSK
jgi:hypothetical protein